ncbi:ogr/Delta-like zinc finger family protein [Pantoea agglomerans]|nr:ogr/Delta-like zinc finger family protein [Pantoea agglomerans]
MYRCPKCGASARTRNSEYLDKQVSPIISATIFTAGSPSAR